VAISLKKKKKNAELYFSKKLWPDFDEKVFVSALYFFQNAERKFGSIPDKL